jgi:hypothetical protein
MSLIGLYKRRLSGVGQEFLKDEEQDMRENGEWTFK